jgi:hypothetical protein
MSEDELSSAAAYFLPEPSRALNCQRSIETLIVPSQDNVTREITITRC